MRLILPLLLAFPPILNAQIFDHNRVFTDTLEYKDFNQGVIDSRVYFNGTRDYFTGFFGTVLYGIPAIISHSKRPNDMRMNSILNPNNQALYSNQSYYQGYKYGAFRKKRIRIRQGFATYLIGLVYLVSRINHMNH